MIHGLSLGIVVLFMTVLSVRERIKLYSYREKDWGTLGESKSSPLSMALTNLYGVAGGIYLSLVLICTFVELQLPERVHLGQFSLEPLAAISITMALVQPYFQKVFQVWRKI